MVLTLSTIIPGSKQSTFDSKAKFELATLETKQAFEKVLGALSFEIAVLFHTEVMNYEHNCKFLNESTRWIHVYFGCSYLFLKVKDLHFVADDHEIILQLNFFAPEFMSIGKKCKIWKVYRKIFKWRWKNILDRCEKNSQTLLMRFLFKVLINIPQDFIHLQTSDLSMESTHIHNYSCWYMHI